MSRRPALCASTSRRFALVLLLALIAASCAAREGDDIGTPIFNGTTPDGVVVEPPRTTLPAPTISAIRVPVDAVSIQQAVDQSQPGDLILVDPGVYSEDVVVSTPDIVIRGRDRNTVFVDGLHSLSIGITVAADGVAIENLTVRNYLNDAIRVGSNGAVAVNQFRALHVTTSNTGDNGLFLQNVTNAELRQGWHSGHGGAGVRIADCSQCNTLVTTTLAEFSNAGFLVSGAAEGVSVFSSTSRNNRVGILVEDSSTQPTSGAVVAGNLVLNNGFNSTPSNDPSSDRSFGVGIQVGGTISTQVAANRVSGNTRVGVLLAPNNSGLSGDPIAPMVSRNVAEGHPESDIVVAFADQFIDPSTCITDNGAATIGPPGAAEAAVCGDANVAPPAFEWTSTAHEAIDYVNGPVPPVIDGLVDADASVPVPAGPVTLPAAASAVVPAG